MLNLFTTAIALTFAFSSAVIANTAHETKVEEKTEVKVEETKEVAAPAHEAEAKTEKKEEKAEHHKHKKHHHHAEKAPAIAADDAVRAPLSEVQENPESVVNEQ